MRGRRPRPLHVRRQSIEATGKPLLCLERCCPEGGSHGLARLSVRIRRGSRRWPTPPTWRRDLGVVRQRIAASGRSCSCCSKTIREGSGRLSLSPVSMRRRVRVGQASEGSSRDPPKATELSCSRCPFGKRIRIRAASRVSARKRNRRRKSAERFTDSLRSRKSHHPTRHFPGVRVRTLRLFPCLTPFRPTEGLSLFERSRRSVRF